MRHAVILAGGSGVRLWPMSRGGMPKQLLPLIHGRSLLQIAWDRLQGLVPPERRWVCAAEVLRTRILSSLAGLAPQRYLGEPEGRDTLAALAFSSAVIAEADPEATIAVLTSDHLIQPEEDLRACLSRGFDTAESSPGVLVTFGVTPSRPATGFGYLRLGGAFSDAARVVEEFKEKPDEQTARQWIADGPERYLWNSGMFVWSARAFLDCVRRYEPGLFDGIGRIARAWNADSRDRTLTTVYPGLKKISVDYGVMEKASRDPTVKVVAVPMSLSWTDIGSWPALAETFDADSSGNRISAGRSVALDTRNTTIVSPEETHLVAVFGCDDLVVVHTPDVTLVCHRDKADELKKLHGAVVEKLGKDLA